MAYSISREVQTEEIIPLRRKLNLNTSNLFATPPSELKKEISILRGEISEIHEFHDFEIQILQEEHDIAFSQKTDTVAELQKSLQNAEDIILDSKKEISHLKSLNQELQQQLKEESNKISIIKDQYENQISEFQLTLKKKNLEIENYEKDKNDCEFHIQLLRKNYEQKIDELRKALEYSCEKSNGNKEHSFFSSERKSNTEYEKTEALNEIRCTFEKEIKKLKGEHNDKLKSLEFINANLKKTNESLTDKLREANEAFDALNEELRIFEGKTELLRKHGIIDKMNDSAGERCSDELEVLDSKVVNSGPVLHEANADVIHVVLKTLRFLGALCSQLNESGSSLNLSNFSFDSFNEDLSSSTKVDDFTEVEMSVVNDATVCNDPLALTMNNTLQTPFKTPLATHKNFNKVDLKYPLNSVSKPLQVPLRTPTGNVMKRFHLTTPGSKESENNLNETKFLELKTSLATKDKEICEIKDMYMKKISDSEEVLTNVLENISLDGRISKLESISADFNLKKEEFTSEMSKMKELLNKKTEETAKIRQILVVESTSLNPQLEGMLTDVDVFTLLDIFMSCIIENCKKMPEELSQKLLNEVKVLNEKTEMYEGKLYEQEKEINVLKELNATLLSGKDEMLKILSNRDDEIKILRFESSELESLRVKVRALEERLEKKDDILETEVYLKKSALKDLQRVTPLLKNIQNENIDLKLKLEQADKSLKHLRTNLIQARKEHLCNEAKDELLDLQDDEDQLNTLKSVLENYKKGETLMRNELEALNSKLMALETELTNKTDFVEMINIELKEANNSKLKCEEIILDFMEKVRDLEKENTSLKSLEPVLEDYKDKEKSMCEEIEKLNMKLKSTEVDLNEKMEIIAKITTQMEETRADSKNKDEKTISELRAKVKEFESTLEQMINENENLSQKVERLGSDLLEHKVNIEEKEKIIASLISEIEQAKCRKDEDMGIISELRSQIEKFEEEITRLRESESTLEKLNEIEFNISERMDVLNSRLSICEADLNEKNATITRLYTEIEEAKKTKIKDDEIISNLRMHIEETAREKLKAEELALLLKKSKDSEEILSEKVKDLSSKLSMSEIVLEENLQLIAETNLKLEKTESINKENMELILELKKQIKNLKETEKILLEKIEDISLNLQSLEAEKIELEVKILSEVEEASKINAKNEEIIEILSLKVKEFDSESAKVEEIEAVIIRLSEKEELMLERIESLNSRLFVFEEAFNEKTELFEQICNQLAEAKLIKAENDNTILALQKELDTLRDLQHLWDATHERKNEKETLIKDLYNKLNELNSEIDRLQKKLHKAESNLKLFEGNFIQLGEMESSLKSYKEMVDELKLDFDKMKESEIHFSKVINELEIRNKELEDANNDLLKKQIDYEKLIENNPNEIKLQEILSSTQERLRLSEGETKNLRKQLSEMEVVAAEMKKTIMDLNLEVNELRDLKSENTTKLKNLEDEKEILNRNMKELEEKEEEIRNTVSNIATKLGYHLVDGSSEIMEWLSFIDDRSVKLLHSHREETKSSKEIMNNMEMEMDSSNKKVLNESKFETFVKPKEMFFEKMTPLKSTPVIERSRIDVSPPHKSRRLEKLENLNDLLNGTLQKIIATLNIPIKVDFFSVDCYETSETQVMKYITSLKFIKNDVPELSEIGNETNVSSEIYEEMCRIMNELKTCLSGVVGYLGLTEEVKSYHEIINQIEKIKFEVKAELLERIAALKQDNQHLRDDNNFLQRRTKKLVKLVTLNKNKISALKKSEELLKTEVESLRSESLKYQGRGKISKKIDLCNRKLSRLEEVHLSLIDLLKKILTKMEMENVQNLNLYTPRTFDIESRKILEHVNYWILKKCNEIDELKSQITELDEECESYAKKIKEDSKQIYKAWEEVRTLELEKGKLEEEKKLLKCDLEKLQVEDVGVDWKKEMENLKENNISLKSQIMALTNELAQSKKQREELDEECESLAMAVKQEGERRIKIWEEFKNEVKNLNERIEKLEEEKKCLELEKENLLKEIKNKENETNNECQDVKGGSISNCHKESNVLKELRSTIVVKEMRILELEQLNEKNIVRKTQIKALENSLSSIKKKLAEENEINQKLHAEIKELSDQKRSQESEILKKLRMTDCSIAVVNQSEERGKLQKLEKDNRMLKELCRTRYNEIKRLETENLSLKGHERITKNSNQMDSPIRTRAYNKTQKNY